MQGRARIRVRLNRVRLGNLGDCKEVGEGVMEFRLDFGPAGDTLVILLCGGDKRTQARDIATAKQYWKSYKLRTS
jgi:putative addiction module killer protein